ncbi:hypothetical conserved protein [Candidatus Nitrosoglobus terrae]|uniref:Hypothetical conserved protein n=1 Tax=Candidatus Nitrosoglobus terrae TaxID=1630141 RepID=A0A1Q2SL71_9GAMM|nr:hypothetical protein [Candidatus Nitrosoglobus terrae]BAW79870.1 hypothetical conserved protein [Candidatus Nitrosoglobus terrae]
MKILISITLMIFSSALIAETAIPSGKPIKNFSGSGFDPSSSMNAYKRYGTPYSDDLPKDPYGRFGTPYSQDLINKPYGRYGSPYNSGSSSPYQRYSPER